MGIQVIYAIYGPSSTGTPTKPNVGVNVSKACQGIFDKGGDDLRVWFTTFGIQDPDPDVVKTLGILYQENGGKPQTRFGVDGQVIHFH